jgi:hypothetical protein
MNRFGDYSFHRLYFSIRPRRPARRDTSPKSLRKGKGNYLAYPLRLKSRRGGRSGMPRPGTPEPPRQNGELDLTDIDYVGIGLAPIQGDCKSRPFALPTIPQEGRDIEIVFVHRGQRRAGGFHLTRLKVRVNAHRFRRSYVSSRLRSPGFAAWLTF